MKAMICTRYGSPDVLQLREVEEPSPRKDEVCIKIFATCVTASDCIVRGFRVRPGLRLPMAIAIGFGRPRNPILGMVTAGEVESKGKDVKGYKEGDAVFAFHIRRLGSYAEYICLPEDTPMSPKPSNLSYEEAAAIPYGGALALHFLRKAGVQKGQQVLIYGASGAVGTAAVQIARHLGAKVTGVCSTANVELVRSLGAEAVIDYTKEDFTNRAERYDLVFNAVGKGKVQLHPERALTPHGKHVTVDDGSPALNREVLNYLRELAEAGKLRPVIDRRYPLEQLAEAHRYVDEGHKKGNVVITVAHGG